MKMNVKEIFETVDSLNESYISVWEEICNIESPTESKLGVDAAENYFAALADAHGWKVEFFRQPISGDVVCITLNPESIERPLCLSAHLDTVHPIGSFGTPAVHRDGEKIYGPGVTDCKGGAVAAVLAMDALARNGFDRRPICLLLQSDEEVGSRLSNKETIKYICERSKDAIAFINLEGSGNDTICVARKGIVSYKFEVHGIEAHSSNCATVGASAIAEAAHKIIELEALKDNDGITCNCGVIEGGSVVNTVPGNCNFYANIRFATKEQFEWVDDYMKKVAEKVHVQGTSCSVSQFSYRTAMPMCERNLKLAEKINRIFAANGMPTLRPSRSNGGSDAADVTEYGIPCVDSIGVSGGKIHSGNEFAYIASLAEAAKRIAVIACELDL